MTRTFSIKTLGCKLNSAESEKISEELIASGWHRRPYGDNVDLVVIKSCAVTDNSEKKTRNYIRQSLSMGSVIVTGCISPGGGLRLKNIEGITSVLPNGTPEAVLEILPEIKSSASNINAVQPVNHAEGCSSGRSREYLKIQDGCDGRCTYCVVPIVRGKPVSRSYEAVIAGAAVLAEKGIQEIILTGVTIGRYSSDGITLAGLIKLILAVDKSFRLRITSIEPDHITDEFLEVFSDARVCPHIHLPLQSGSDRVLQAMNRPYNTERYMISADKLRKIKPDLALGSDIIIGFPTETEDDFNDTLNFMRKCSIAYSHIFTFSPRTGTAAYGLKPVYSGIDLRNRRNIIDKISRDLETEYISRFSGTILPCVIERSGENDLIGTSGNYIKIMITGGSCEPGTTQYVRLNPGYPPSGVVVSSSD
jgi:threonylcarbamoyladenosine tRNA methylthiotransferase MtaB